jgi:hypothetical protein
MAFSDNQNAPPNPSRAKISESEVALRRALKTAPQDLWLDTIRRTRSDAHNSLIYWMLSQPECDFAIAVHAFYRSNPMFHLDNPKPLPPRPGPANLFALVLLNWDTGSFRTHYIKVEPTDAHPRVIAQLNEKLADMPRGTLPFDIPKSFLDPDGGIPIQVPPHLSPDDASHHWPHYADLGLRVPDTAPGMQRSIERAKVLLKKVGIVGK